MDHGPVKGIGDKPPAVNGRLEINGFFRAEAAADTASLTGYLVNDIVGLVNFISYYCSKAA
jgi:hypothetical protein